MRVYRLAYLGDRGLVWEPGICLLLQQLWLDDTKLMGLHISICSMRMVKSNGVSQSGFGSVQSQTTKQISNSHKETDHTVANVAGVDNLLSVPSTLTMPMSSASGVPPSGLAVCL